MIQQPHEQPLQHPVLLHPVVQQHLLNLDQCGPMQLARSIEVQIHQFHFVWYSSS